MPRPQSGTAVLVDKYGVLRARCFCGTPHPAEPAGHEQLRRPYLVRLLTQLHLHHQASRN